MRQAFVIRVKEKEAHLKDTEKEVIKAYNCQVTIQKTLCAELFM